jgi:hypothetical protein
MQLEEHHQVEDHDCLPLFRGVEPRLAPGFELFESDHGALHSAIGGVIEPIPCWRARGRDPSCFALASPACATPRSISGAR